MMSEPAVQLCIATHAPGPRTRVRISAALSAARGLALTVSSTPRNAALSTCVDLAVRGRVVPLVSRVVGRGVVRASLGVRGVGAPPSMPPTPDGPRPFDEAAVHAALDAARGTLLGCITDLAPGVPGEVELRVAVHADGRMTLEGVELPTGVRGPGSLACLAGHAGALRVPPPGREVRVAHAFRLGAR